ncbi:MAG: DUF6020 family protein [Lachnospiraceae bacterium]|nr:DUF6020 family protein [Lachnospiraceae bacterium]
MNKYINKKLFIMCAFFGLFVAVCEVLGLYLDDKMAKLSNSAAYYLVSVILWLLGTALVLYCGCIFGKKLVSNEKQIKGLFSKFWIYWIIIAIAWMPCFIAYFPGIYSYDGEPQLIQYLSGSFDNHHPVLHTLILGWCYDFGLFLQRNGINIEGLCFYSILQLLFLSFSYAKIIEFLIKRKTGRTTVTIVALFFALFPVHPIMAISTTKDTVFAAFFILFLLELINMLEPPPGLYEEVDTKEKGILIRGKRIRITAPDLKLFFFGAGTMLFRRNGYYVILLTLILFLAVLVIRSVKQRKNAKASDLQNEKSESKELPPQKQVYGNSGLVRAIVVILISVIFFLTSEKVLILTTGALGGESAEALNLPLEQIGRAYKNNEQQMREEFGERLDKFIPQEGLANYRPFISDGIKMWFNNEYFNEHKGEFVGLYFDIGKKYFSDYVMAALYLTRGDWYMTDTSHCEVYKDWWRDRVGYMITDATPVFALEYVKKSNPLPAVRDLYESIVTDMSYRNNPVTTILFSPALYVFLTILSGMAFIVKKRKDLLLSWFPVFVYLLTVIAGPCVLVRYIFPFMITVPVFAVLALKGDNDITINESSEGA